MKTKILLLTSIVFILFSSCEDVLDRPQLSSANDDTYWVNENNVRLFMNEYYPYLFVGYNTNWGTNYTPITGYAFSDDVMTAVKQTNFDTSIPASVGNATPPTSTVYNDFPAWQAKYTGPTWNFYWVRKSNLMIDRVEKRMGNILNEEQRDHWIGIAKFFRAMWYANMVQVFGDVPYYDHLVLDTELDELYKDRTPRDKVMDAVYDDLKFALEKVRLNDGEQSVNRYIVAGFASRLMLIEGTWQKYHYNNTARAQKFLQFSQEASEFLMNSGKYDIVTDFRSLFGSEDLKGNKDCILYRHYSSSKMVTHSVATYSNLVMPDLNVGANLSLLKSFICNDGNVWQNSELTNADQFNIANLVKTRDPRFEATFYDKPRIQSKTAIYACKFISREGTSYGGVNVPAKFTSTNNTNDYPIIRYSEILLNWIESKAELATLGGAAVSQTDIDKSINKIRNRPLDAEAISKGVTKTKPMVLATITDSYDPARDEDVTPLIWEIRRERRMEFFFEHSRIGDLRRWKKLSYMNGTKNPDILRSIWIDIPNELPELLIPTNSGKVSVIKADGTRVTYNGNNAADMVGYFSPPTVADRDPFENVAGVNVYLAPIGLNQINDYESRGYTLTQTTGWGGK